MKPKQKPKKTAPKTTQKLSDYVISWIERNCYVPEGKHVGKPIKLREFQKAEIRKIYDNPKGTRRAIISWARKNAKTTFASFLLLVHLASKRLARLNSQLFSAAQSRDQAGILFSLAAKMVRISPTLRDLIQVSDA